MQPNAHPDVTRAQQVVQDGAVSTVEVLPDLSKEQQRFAARIALGDTMSGSTRYAGVSRQTGYNWIELPEVKRAIIKYAGQRVDAGRRVIVGEVVHAARVLRRLMRPGGSAHKGAPTELAAALAVLKLNRIDEVPVTQTQRAVLTFIPREGRTTGQDRADEEDTDTLAAIEAAYREDSLPLLSGPDGLPPDFPTGDGSGYVQPDALLPDSLKDPDTYLDGARRSAMWREGG